MPRVSTGERLFNLHCKLEQLPPPETEFRFHDKRKWRFDFAWPEYKIAVEVEGGVFQNGRHTRGTGFESDCEKYNAASEGGWRVFRYSTKQVSRRDAVRQMKRVFIHFDNETEGEVK